MRRELTKANIRQGDRDDIECTALLGEGAYGKVGTFKKGLSLGGGSAAVVVRHGDATVSAVSKPNHGLAKGLGGISNALISIAQPHSCASQVYKGTWKGTTVAIKCVVLPANMSGQEKREKMAIMEAAVRGGKWGCAVALRLGH